VFLPAGSGAAHASFDGASGGRKESPPYDAQDRLRLFEGTGYSYTDRGSLFQRDDGTTLHTFTYDPLGNLTSVATAGAPTIDYVIDARGRRIGQQVGGVLQKQYVWSDPLRIAAELDDTGQIVSRFIYGAEHINVPALVVRPDPVNGDKIYRVITDHLGSPVYVVNIANPRDVLLDAEYDEWGQVTSFTSSSGTWPIPFGFAGGLYDADTGMVRFGLRDYDPVVGRWTSKYPILFGGAGEFVSVRGE
jgi:RHS repeat-associated protein